MKIYALTLILLLSVSPLQAKSLGVVGETFPVAEMSFLVWIESRLKALEASGEIKNLEERFTQRVVSAINRPTPLPLPRAVLYHEHMYVPEVVLNQDLSDAKGRIFAHRGERANALQRLTTYKPHWIFFNGDDEAQVAWARRVLQKKPTAKVILTGGAVGDMERALQHEIYFDQAARITTKLNITHVPAKVIRKEDALLIQEIAIKEDGDAR